MKFIGFLLFKLLPLTIVAALVALPFLVLDSTTGLSPARSLSAADTARVKALIKQNNPAAMEQNQTTEIRMSGADLDLLVRGAAAVLPGGRASSFVSADAIDLAVGSELPLPENPLGRYVTLELSILPSDTGLELGALRIGKLAVPPGLVVPGARMVLNRVLGNDQGTAMVNSIQAVSLSSNDMRIAYHPTTDVVAALRTAATDVVRLVDPDAVAAYVTELTGLRTGDTSLTPYLRRAFALAQIRSATGDPVAENKAAILAIAIVFGDTRFANFAGDLKERGLALTSDGTKRARLAGRRDFVQHFSISAGLQLTGGSRASALVYELKEVLDSGKTSGFSFTDLAADRAGAKLAEDAQRSASSARDLQNIMAGAIGEDIYFPETADLPEGLSETEFMARYGGIDAAPYAQMVEAIDTRIAALPAFSS